MIARLTRFVVLSGVFLVPLIPFLVTESMFFPFITGKNFAFRIIVEIILCAWLLLAASDQSYRPKRSPVMWGVLLFLVVMTIADVFGAHPLRSLWSNFERMEGLMGLLHLGAYFFVVSSVLKTEKLWKQFFNASVIVSVAMVFYAFFELAGVSEGVVRLDATFGNSTYLAVYLLIHIFLTLLLAYKERSQKLLSVVYLIAAALQGIVLFYTGTRGAILGVAGGAIVAGIIVLIRGQQHPTLRKFSAIVLMGVALIVGVFLLARKSSFVAESTTLSRLANISLKDTTVQSRFLLWTSIGWEGFKERPILGWGQDNFIVVFGKYYDPLMYKQEPWFDRAHNVFMDWLIAGGILGLLSYLFLFGAGLYVLFKESLPVPEKALIVGLLAAYFFNNLFVFDNLISYVYFITILAYVHARFVNTESELAPITTDAVTDRRLHWCAGASVVLAVLLVYFLNVPYIARARTLINALSFDYAGRYDAAFAEYQKAIAYGGIGVEEAKEQLTQSAIRVWRGNTPPEAKEAVAKTAYDALALSIKKDPENTRPLFFMGYLLSQTVSPEEGLVMYQNALAINPTRQNFLYEVGRIYIAINKPTEAIATFKTAYDVAPENDQALGYYTGALLWNGQVALGEELLLERFGTTTVDHPLVLEAYVKQGMFAEGAAILEQRLRQMAPLDDAQTRISLAFLYAQLHDPVRAIAHIEQAMILDPRFAVQGQQMIDTLKAGGGLPLQ